MKQSEITQILNNPDASPDALLALAADPQGQDALVCIALGERDERLLSSIIHGSALAAQRAVKGVLSRRLPSPDMASLSAFTDAVARLESPNAGVLSVSAWATWVMGDDDSALDLAHHAQALAAGQTELAGAAIALIEAGETPQSVAKEQSV
jgi:hypothetical protein